MNHGDYVYFQYTASNPSFQFRTYTDQTGRGIGFVEGKDRHGEPIYRLWKFDSDIRKISVHKNKTDQNGVSAIDFLRNMPNCKDSPNGAYIDGNQIEVFFEEVNDAKTAKVGLDFETLRIKAQNIALEIKNQDFIDICALIGVFNKDETVMRFALVDYAKNKPQSFMDMVEDPIRQIRSVIRRAIHENVFNKQGKMLTWENVLVGVDEDDAVSKLKTDEKLLKAIKANLEKIK